MLIKTLPIAAVLSLAFQCQVSNAESLPQWQKNMIRSDIQTQILNRPATIQGMTAEDRIIAEWFRPSVQIDSPRYAPSKPVPDIQAFQGIDIPFERVLSLLSKTLGYETPISLRLNSSILGTGISLNDRFNTLDDLVSYLESQTGTRIALYPEARTIIVSPVE